MPKFRIHEFYRFTKTYEVDADDYDDAWEQFWQGEGDLIHNGERSPELSSQECEDVTEYA